MKKSKFSEEQIAFALRKVEAGRSRSMSVTSLGLRERVSSSAVGFSTTVDSQKPVDYDVVAIGARVTVDASEKSISSTCTGTHSNIVDLSVQHWRK